MNIASDWAVRIKAFHEKQLDRPRRVYRLGRTKILLTRGQIVSTLGATFGAVSVDSPDWLFWLAAVGGFVGGKYFYPVLGAAWRARTASGIWPGDLPVIWT